MKFHVPKVSVIVLNYNGGDCLPACLLSLQNISYENRSVIVVDNGSTDHSLERAKQTFPSFVYLPLSENRGFAGGMNKGIARAIEEGAEWVWLMNNDAVVEAESLTSLMKVAEGIADKKIGALSPLIIDQETEEVWFGKGRIDYFRMRVVHEELSSNERQKKFLQSEFLTGCALLLNVSALKEIGFLDESFFLYYEDADVCLRLRKAEWETLVVPGARVFHAEKSKTNPLKLYHLVYSGLLFFRKHADFRWRIYFSVYATIRRIKNTVDIWRGRDEARSVRRAYEDFFQ